MTTTSPAAPGGLGIAARPAEYLDYLGRLDAWLAELRAELDALDAQIVGSARQAELTADMTLAMALWQAAKTRQNLLLATWDSGRVGQQELERLSTLIWGRLDTDAEAGATLASMAVSLPEAGRLTDALVAQLRTRLNTDPTAEQQQIRLRDLRAQLERIREQVKLEPAALAPAAQARLAGLATRLDELADSRGRGGDIAGSLGTLEIDAAHTERDLIVNAAQRREARDLLIRAREQVTAVTAREQAVRSLAGQVAAALWPAPADPIPSVAALGPLPNTRTALVGWTADLSGVDAALGRAQAAMSAALAARDQASARFAELEASAQQHGVGQDAGLADLATSIRSRLAQRPTPLPVLAHLLQAYRAEVDFLTGGQP